MKEEKSGKKVFVLPCEMAVSRQPATVQPFPLR
jgi:hypothetical protein